MRGILLMAAGLCLAGAAVRAQATSLPPAKPEVHAHVATSLLYHQPADSRLSPLVTRPALPVFSELTPQSVVRYYPVPGTPLRYVQVTERTYLMVEDTVPTPPPRSRR